MNPVGLVSDNFSTVRCGSKWAERTADPADRIVLLVDSAGKSHGTAEVVDCWVGPLVQLPAIAIECSHDPVMRTWSGVAQVLAGLYPEVNVDFQTIVTCLRLKHKGSIIQV